MASSSFEFEPSGVLQGKIVWSSSSNGPVANSSNVTATLYARRTNNLGPTYGRSWEGYVRVGSAQTNINFSSVVYVNSSWVEMAKVTTTISHSADGSGSVSISGSVKGPDGTSLGNNTSSGSTIAVLDRIPRYTSISSFVVDKATETSLKFKWQTADTIDYAWYSTDNGSNWTGYNVTDGKTGEFTVSGLTANTSYNCKIRVRRKDSQLNTDSNAVKQTTYDYPYCTNTPNFVIGNQITLSFYNPLGRNFTFYIIANGTQIANSWTTNTTSYTGLNDESTLQQLYATIPNANSAKYQVKVIYSSSTKTRNNNNTYSVNVNNSKPIFSNFEYADTNSTTTALTGNNQILVKGYSNNKVTISTANKATAQNSATMKTYKIVQGSKSSGNLTYSSSAAVTYTLNAISNNVITVSATDSRNNTTSVAKTLNSTYYKEYSSLIIKSGSITRNNNGVSEKATLKISGTYWNQSFGSVTNDIINATYQYKLTTSSSWTTGTTTLSVTKNGTNFSISQTVNGDLGIDGFSLSNVYDVRVTITDNLSSSTYSLTLNGGEPAIAFYNNNIAIGQKYDTTRGGRLQVKGNQYNTGSITAENGFVGNVSGNASSATNVGMVLTNPETAITYFIPFITSANGNTPERANNGLRYITLEGTTETTGIGEIRLGNATHKGTSGNKRGQIRFYSEEDGLLCIRPTANITGDFTLYFPGISATLQIQRAMAQLVYARQSLINSTAWDSTNLTSVESSSTVGSGLAISGSTIKINNSRIQKIKVTASVRGYKSDKNCDIGFRISVANSETDIFYHSTPSEIWTMGSSETMMFDVSQNDLIRIKFWTGIANTTVEHLGTVLFVEDITHY